MVKPDLDLPRLFDGLRTGYTCNLIVPVSLIGYVLVELTFLAETRAVQVGAVHGVEAGTFQRAGLPVGSALTGALAVGPLRGHTGTQTSGTAPCRECRPLAERMLRRAQILGGEHFGTHRFILNCILIFII